VTVEGDERASTPWRDDVTNSLLAAERVSRDVIVGQSKHKLGLNRGVDVDELCLIVFHLYIHMRFPFVSFKLLNWVTRN
jgi:hypothetical protein